MIRPFNPASIAAPAARYVHGIEIPPTARLLVASGQIGMRPDGNVPASIEEQSEAVWTNIHRPVARRPASPAGQYRISDAALLLHGG
jgi:enamine deaminase RidA (YjgF/YER057c/UK114 family)